MIFFGTACLPGRMMPADVIVGSTTFNKSDVWSAVAKEFATPAGICLNKPSFFVVNVWQKMTSVFVGSFVENGRLNLGG
jgi:hypothetical protein